MASSLSPQSQFTMLSPPFVAQLHIPLPSDSSAQRAKVGEVAHQHHQSGDLSSQRVSQPPYLLALVPPKKTMGSKSTGARVVFYALYHHPGAAPVKLRESQAEPLKLANDKFTDGPHQGTSTAKTLTSL